MIIILDRSCELLSIIVTLLFEYSWLKSYLRQSLVVNCFQLS